MASGTVDYPVLFNVILVLVFLVATASNSLVLLVFYRKPRLRTLSNKFVINLLGTNLLTCWLLLPLMLSNSLLSEPSRGLCVISQGASHGFSTASVLSVLLIAVDQYYAVVDPLLYHSHIDHTKCAIMVASSWSFSAFCASMGSIFYDAPHSIWKSCDQQSDLEEFAPLFAGVYISIFSFAFSAVTFVMPFMVICWMYLNIYFAAHENSERTRRNGSSAGFNPANNRTAPNNPPVDYAVVPPAGQLPDPIPAPAVEVPEPPAVARPTMARSPTRSSLRSTSGIMNSLRCRISNASMFRYREETRAARISALVIVMGLVCWCPYSLVVLLQSPVIGIQVPYCLAKLSIGLLMLTSVISPLLFAHRNRRVQRDIRRLFGMARPTNSFPTGSSPRARTLGSLRLPNRPPANAHNACNAHNAHNAHNAPEFLGIVAEAGDEQRERCTGFNQQTATTFLSRVWWKEGSQIVTKLDKVAGKSLICVPEVVIDVDNSRSSFSSGGSASTQMSTSATSICSFLGEEF